MLATSDPTSDPDIWQPGNPSDYAEQAEEFRREGVAFIRNALSEEHMKLIDAAFQWRIDNIHATHAVYQYPDQKVTNLQSMNCSMGVPQFIRIIRETPLSAMAAAMIGSEDVWYWQDQLFLKQGSFVRRTFWHQDMPYSPLDGESAVVFWINLGDTKKEEALECIRKSHIGPIYNPGSLSDPNDDTAPLYPDGHYPRLPNIEAERDKWDIVSWEGKRGDVLAFHPNTLHGGGATSDERRTLSFRFIGDDVVRVFRPDIREDSFSSNPKRQRERGAEDTCGLYSTNERAKATLRIGEPFHHVGLPKVRSARS